MNKKYKLLLQNLFLFSISSFFPKFLSIILIPLYTSVLTPDEVATGEIINTTAWLMTPIISLCMRDAVLRFCLDRNSNKKSILSNAFVYQIFSTIFLLLVCFSLYLLNIEGLENNFLFFTGLMIFTNCVNDTLNSFCRGIDKVKTITYGSVINSSFILATNALFLLVFHWGFNGYMLANCIGPIITIIFISLNIKVWKYISFHIDTKLLKLMLLYSTPIILSSLLNWINGGAIKYILPWMIGLTSAGIFTTCSKIPNLIGVVQTVFNSAWQISAVKELDKEDKDGFMGNIFHITLFALLICSSVLMILNKPIACILFKGEFFTAYKYTAPLYVSMIFVMCSTFIDGIFISLKKTKIIALTSIIGAVAIITSLLVLVFFFDIYGAAFATLLGNIILFSSKYLILKRRVHLKINIKRIALSLSLMFSQMLLALIIPDMIWPQIPFTLLIFAINKIYLKKSIEVFKGVAKNKSKANKH